MRVNPELVVKQGLLFKKGQYLRVYKKQYLFYLEKRDEGTLVGPLLKYGKKGKTISDVVDLSVRSVDQTEGINGVLVVRDPDSQRKFKVITQEGSLLLKAETHEERESWIHALVQETQGGMAGPLQSMYGDDKSYFNGGDEQIDTRLNPKSSKELKNNHNHHDEPLAFRMFAQEGAQKEPSIS